MSLDEIRTHRDAVDVWLAMHPFFKQQYAGDANEKLLLDGAKLFRPCLTAVDRAYAQGNFTRTDGHDAKWDRQRAAQRKASQEAELDAAATADPAFIEHIMSLSLPELQQAYYGDGAANAEFARRYRAAVRDHGFRIPSRPAAAQAVR